MKKMEVLAMFLAVTSLGIFSQDTLIMPVTGNGGIYNTCYATIYDNGGPDSNYANYSLSTITIAPLWIQQVDLYFEIFDTEIFFDSLSIYDGPGTTFPLIGTYSGNQLQGQTVSSTGTSITLSFRSDDIQTGAGFKAWVSCLMGEEVEEGNNPLFVYPNPVTDYFTIGGIQKEDIENIIVIDVTGKILKTDLSLDKIYVTDFTSGLYGLVVELNDGKTEYLRWMKI